MNNCIVCNCDTNKYKCPSCSSRYCGLDCYKKHKDGQCIPKEKNDLVENDEDGNKSTTDYLFPTEDTVPVDKLKLLDNDEALKTLLRNPHLRRLLTSVDKAENPVRAMREAMMIPLFVEFSDACLKILEPNPIEGVAED